MRRNDPNLAMVQQVADGLGALLDDVVFVGGCAAGLLITDPGAPPARETRDVDLIAEIASTHDYHRLSEKLRVRGFREDSGADSLICRWRFGEAIVDVMPTDSAILGFSNRWYAEAMANGHDMQIPNGLKIRMVAGPWFLATKLEAFHGRGRDDLMASHDLEDVIAVIDGRGTIVEEVREAGEVGIYLAEQFSHFLSLGEFHDAILCHLPADMASQQRATVVIERMQAISKIGVTK